MLSNKVDKAVLYWLKCSGCVYSNGIRFQCNENDEVVYTENNFSGMLSTADDRVVRVFYDIYSRSLDLITVCEMTGFLQYAISLLMSNCVSNEVLNFKLSKESDGDYIFQSSGPRSYLIVLKDSETLMFHSEKSGYTLFDMLSDMGNSTHSLGSSMLSAGAFVTLKEYLLAHSCCAEFLDETGHIVRVHYDSDFDDILVTLDDGIIEILYNTGWTYRGHWWNLAKLLYAVNEKDGNLKELQACEQGLYMRSLYSMYGIECDGSDYDLFREASVEYDNSPGAVRTFDTLYQASVDSECGLHCFSDINMNVKVIYFGVEYGQYCIFKNSMGVFVFSNLVSSIVDGFREVLWTLRRLGVTYYVDSSGHEQELRIFD